MITAEAACGRMGCRAVESVTAHFRLLPLETSLETTSEDLSLLSILPVTVKCTVKSCHFYRPFCGPGTAVGLMCVCVCVSVRLHDNGRTK